MGLVIGARAAVHKQGPTRNAFFNFTKQMFGAGILALPHAFKQSGLMLGIAVYVLATLLCSDSMVLLCRVKQEARRRLLAERDDECADTGASSPTNDDDDDDPSSSSSLAHLDTYCGLAKHVFSRRCPPRAARRVYACVAALVVVTELCFCSGWVIVASDNIAVVAASQGHPVARARVAFALFPVIAALACIPFLKDLWGLSVFGLVVYCGGVMGLVYGYLGHSSAHGRLPPPSYPVRDAVWPTLPFFFGQALYSLEAILMALPIEGSMRSPRKVGRVIWGGMAIYGSLAGAFGAIAYAFGLGACDVDGGGALVTDCLPRRPGHRYYALTVGVRLALAATMVLGYPCILYPISEILEENFLPGLARGEAAAEEQAAVARRTKESRQGPSSSSWCRPRSWKRPSRVALQRSALRTGEVLVTCVVAASFTNFAVFSSLVGALFVALAGFVLPPVLHVALFGGLRAAWRDPRAGPRRCLLNLALVGFGTVACVLGTKSALQAALAPATK